MTFTELQQRYTQELANLKSLEDSRDKLSATIRASRRSVATLVKRFPRGAQESALCSWLDQQVAAKQDTLMDSPGHSSDSDLTRCDCCVGRGCGMCASCCDGQCDVCWPNTN